MLIEVLISVLIISASIVTISAGMKMFFQYKQRQENYQNLYITVLSLKDEIENMKLKNVKSLKDRLNGFNYTVSVTPIRRLRNYIYTYNEAEETSGNKGGYDISLYKVKVNLNKGNFRKDIEFYITQYNK